MDRTRDVGYAHRLVGLSSARWKTLLDVQAPYRWNLRRQQLGRTLDVGCGIGRNLSSLPTGSVGVDHNPHCVAVARERGLVAYSTSEWVSEARDASGHFDSLLMSHVIEHMPRSDALALIQAYLPSLRAGGKVFFICPQERGYRSDSTHVQFTSGEDLESLAGDAGLLVERWRNFPLPRIAGRFFTYNEFTLLARKPSG